MPAYAGIHGLGCRAKVVGAWRLPPVREPHSWEIYMMRTAPYGRRGLLGCFAGTATLAASARLALAAEAEIAIDNFKFSPTPLTVKRGTTVTWTNRDDIPHSIVIPALAVHSQPMDTNERFSYRFDQVGTFAYLCGIHTFMHGSVIARG
jgi:plastocyanin